MSIFNIRPKPNLFRLVRLLHYVILDLCVRFVQVGETYVILYKKVNTIRYSLL